MSEILPAPDTAPESTAKLPADTDVADADPGKATAAETSAAHPKSGVVKSIVLGAVLGALVAATVIVTASSIYRAEPVRTPVMAVSPETEARLSQSEAVLRALESRIKAVEARPQVASTGVSVAPEVESRLSRLEAAVASTKSEPKAPAGIEALATSAHATAMVVVLDNLAQHIARDAAFAVPLKTLADLAADPVRLAVLKPYADTGLPNSRTLSEAFAAIAPALVPVETPPSGDWMDRIWINTKKLVKIRSRSDAVATDPAGLVQRMSLALAQNRWQEVLDLGARLPPQSQDKAKDVLKSVQARRDGEQAVQTLLDQALAAIVPPKN